MLAYHIFNNLINKNIYMYKMIIKLNNVYLLIINYLFIIKYKKQF